MKIKITNEEIQPLLELPVPEFPKYTTQLINLASQNAQATRPKVVGQMSELIRQFPQKHWQEWEECLMKRIRASMAILANNRFRSNQQLIKPNKARVSR
ncbi:MAG: MjaI family restriction endonuclease [candidate division KSB1 bacterium]|nr:MjaI family restriction endonuclease [candidate division KSB1 bacterium]MDZ7368575.1 MjaI family restriction endonuclease [candidate division KSB1 bacterium]